jgi:hypothetical protein
LCIHNEDEASLRDYEAGQSPYEDENENYNDNLKQRGEYEDIRKNHNIHPLQGCA